MNNGSHRFRAIPLALLRGLFAFGGDRRGNIAAMTALLIVPLVGAMGMAIETADWYLNQRAIQNAADSAALAAGFNGGTATSATCASPGTFDCEAKAVAAKYGFTNGLNNVSVSATCMATTAVGNCSAGTCPGGATSCYTVSITKKLPISLTALVGFQGTTTIGSQKAVLIAASATSQPGAAATGGGCMLALNKGNVTGFSVTGITTLTLNSCGLYDNATGSDAFDVSGIANITASAIDISGGKTISGIFTSTPTPTTGASATSDPYASDSVSVGSGCDQTNKVVNSNTTFTATGSTPYVFCGGLSAPGTATITLNPGIYVIKTGNLSLTGIDTIQATGGVTIYLTGGAVPVLSGIDTINIVAPTTGPTAGLAIWEDAASSPGSNINFSGISGLNFTGALYFPNHTLTIGGIGSGSNTCGQVIADKIVDNGILSVGSSCAGTGVKPIGGTPGSVTRLIL